MPKLVTNSESTSLYESTEANIVQVMAIGTSAKWISYF